jgi:hypothetical protein
VASEDAAVIKAACDAVVADTGLRAELDEHGNVVKTFCNFAVQRVAHAVGYDGFADLMADEIYELCKSSPEWGAVTASQAATAAGQGLLVLAAHEYLPHGHVCVVYPGGGLVYSGTWKADAPIVANVGHKNGIMGANFAFPVADTQPTYFIWTKKAE